MSRKAGFSELLRQFVIKDQPDPEVQAVDLKYELEWERRGNRAFERQVHMSNKLKRSATPSTYELALDIGCGKGAMLAALAKNCTIAVGIDFSPHYVLFALALMQENGFSSTFLAVAEAENLPFHKNTFTFVSALDVVEHMHIQEKGVQEAVRVLSRSGQLFMNNPNRFSIMAPEDHCRLWFVGFLPYSLQAKYVRWKSGRSYSGTRLLSYWAFKRIVIKQAIEAFHITTTPFDNATIAECDSGAEALLRKNKSLRFLLNSPPFKWVAPSQHILAIK